MQGTDSGTHNLGQASAADAVAVESSADRGHVAQDRKRSRRRTDAAPSRQRSAVTNGTQLVPGVDNRSTWIRRLNDVIEQHVADKGGQANLSEAEHSIIRRAAVLTVELERLEAAFATAGQASTDDLDLYQRASGSLRRLLETVGLKRAKAPVKSFDEYVAEIRAREVRP